MNRPRHHPEHVGHIAALLLQGAVREPHTMRQAVSDANALLDEAHKQFAARAAADAAEEAAAIAAVASAKAEGASGEASEDPGADPDRKDPAE